VKQRIRREVNMRAEARLGRPVPESTPIHHTTPLDAGGCPIGEGNLVSDAELEGSCRRIDQMQTALQGR
jgi:hypothetical protein